MSTVDILPDATIFVTGVNGLIGSHVVDQLLQRGYHVRGAVRDVVKNEWLAEYFNKKYPDGKFEMVGVPDATVEGCYDDVVHGAQGFIHIASPVGGFEDARTAVPLGVSTGINALTAASKTPSIKRVVFTSSSVAATMPKPNVEFSIDETTYNEEVLEIVKKDPFKRGMYIYAALKTETEKAMWKWMADNKPGFVLNTILPNANFGALLVPEKQGFPSTIAWGRATWTGDGFQELAHGINPQWYISPVDCALLHISAAIHSDVKSERLFGFATTWTFNQILAFYRKEYPERKFPEDIEGMGLDKMSVPNERAEDLLKRVKGSGWDGLEQGLKEMTAGWARE